MKCKLGSFIVSPLLFFYTQTNSTVSTSVNIDENITVIRNVAVTIAAVDNELEVFIEMKRLSVRAIFIYIYTSKT